MGDRLDVLQWRPTFSDYGKESKKASKESASFVGSPEWIASIVIVAFAAALYAYAMHAHFWNLW